MQFKPLNLLLHNPLRLAIMHVLISDEIADFKRLKEKTAATAGNLSAQLTKLKDAGYVEIDKQFRDNYPLTICKISEKGLEAYLEYTTNLKEYILL
jgi:DNA-binding transcriptional ArsR family regulator